MAKRVAVIASGETERRAIPHLVHHLSDSGSEVIAKHMDARAIVRSSPSFQAFIAAVENGP